MKILSQVLSYLMPLFYLIAVLIYYTIFLGKKKALEFRTTPLLVALLIAHAGEIATRLITLRTMPLSTVFDALSFFSFSILLIYILIESSIKNRSSGFLIILFAFVLKLISSFSYSWDQRPDALLTSSVFAIHASLTLMGYTAISLSAIYALMYVIQHRNMKKRHFGAIYRQMPSLDYLERMSIRSVAIGVVLLGLGIVFGHVQANRVFGSPWPIDPKVIITDIIWVLYLMSYVLARALRWRGTKMAYFSLSGFVVLMASGMFVYFLFETFHKFY